MEAEDTFVVKSIKLHTAISNIDINSITQILNIAEGAGSTTLTKLLLYLDSSEDTALSKAVKVGNDVIVLKLLRSAKAIADNNDTLTKLLLSTNILGETALHCAAKMQFINDAIPRKLLNFAKYAGGNTLTKLLLSLDNSNKTALHKAVEVGNDGITQKLLRNSKAIADNNYTLIKLLLSLDSLEDTALDKAVKVRNNVVAQKLLRRAEAIADNNSTLTKLLLPADNFKKTVLHKAVEAENDVIVQQLLHTAKGIIGNNNIIFKKLLVFPNKLGDTALHKAVKVENDVVVQELLRSARDIADNKDTLTKLLLSPNISGETALHYAATNRKSGILTKLLLSAENVKDGNVVLMKLLLSTDIFGGTALDDAIRIRNTNIVRILLVTAEYVGKDTLKKLTAGFNRLTQDSAVGHVMEREDINKLMSLLKDARKSKYFETHTLKTLLLVEESKLSYLTRDERSTHKALENVIDQDSSDNPANKENENVDAKSDGWLKWLKDSLQLPTIFKGTEANVIENKIAYFQEEQEDFNQTNDIPSTSHVDRALEIVGYNTNDTAANSSSIPQIGNDINNISVQEAVPSITANTMLLCVALFSAVLNNLGINISLYNNYISPRQEHEMKVKELTLSILPTLQMNKDLFGDDVPEEELQHLLYTNNSVTHLQGDIQENEH